MDSEILDQITNLEKNVASELTKPKRGRRKKTETKMNETEDNDVRDKRERLVACILSGNSKTHLGKEYTEQQIKVQMKCFFLFPNLKEQQKSGRLPFTVS